jgi:hypothetical protein
LPTKTKACSKIQNRKSEIGGGFLGYERRFVQGQARRGGGIVGRDRAGKSTLLKIFSRITEPTKGYIPGVVRPAIVSRTEMVKDRPTSFMITVLTLCSANYLAYAKTLGDSLREHNPDFHFVIGLVDRIPEELDPSYWEPFELIPVEYLGITQFAEMLEKYDIAELNTAVKPFYMAYLYERDQNAEVVIYLDPDIVVYGRFNVLLDKLKQANIVITPHSCTYDDSSVNIFYEKAMLCKGIYNLGFIATRRNKETFAFLRWWQKRLVNHCFYRPGEGMFFDQLWVVLVPLYFAGVSVVTDPGYNASFWNYFERRLCVLDGKYYVNEKHELVFFHFSGFKAENPDASVSRGYPMSSFCERPDLRPVYEDYRSRLLARNYILVKSIRWRLAPEVKAANPFARTHLKSASKKILSHLPPTLRQWLKRGAQFVANSC